MQLLKYLSSLLFIVLIGCAGSDIFPDIGNNLSNPITLAVDSSRDRLYVNNSNFRVSYETGSLHVVDISDPSNPVRVKNSGVPSFSGPFYLDSTGQLLYTPNRESDGEADRSDHLFRFNINEGSSEFLSRTSFSSGDDPYGIACCDSENRMLIASEEGNIDYYDLDNNMAHASQSLTSDLSTGATLLGEGATRILIFGSQAVVTRRSGGIWIVNIDELGVSGKEPVDYIILDVNSPRGIATDGTYLYVLNSEIISDEEKSSLFVLDISSLTARTDNTTAEAVDKDDDSLLVKDVDLVDPDPREIVLSSTNAYVTHFDTAKVSVVDLNSLSRSGEIAVGNEPYGMALYSPGGTATHLLVANSKDNTISIIDLSDNTIVGTYP